MVNTKDFHFEYKTIAIDDCVFTGRKKYAVNPNDLELLMKSIDENGMLQPIIVCHSRQDLHGKWEIIDGKRRVLALRELGIKTIEACVVLKYLTKSEKSIFDLAHSTKNIDLTEVEVERLMNG